MAPKKSQNVSNDNEIISEVISIENSVLQQILDRLTNIESKLDITNNLVNKLEEKVTASENKLKKVESELATLTANYSEIVARLDFLQKENQERIKETVEAREEGLAAKIALNKVQQRGRICTIRVMNMKDEVKTSREAASYLYNELFKSVFMDKQGNHPGPFRSIEYAHILPSPPGKAKKFQGYNYIVRFTGRYFKQPVIDGKKELVADYNKNNNLHIKIAQDYTYTNRQALSFLHDQEDVSKITVRGDRLLVKLQADGNEAAWREILNPYARVVANMIG